VAAWIDITSPTFWQAQTLVDSGTAIPSAPGAIIDATKGACFTALTTIFYAKSGGTVLLNNVGVSALNFAYLNQVGTTGFPHFSYSGGNWVPSAQTHSGYVLPALKYIGPTIPTRSDMRVTLIAPAAASGATAVFCIPGPWADVLAVPNPSGFGASGNMAVPITYSPTFDPVVGGADLGTTSVGDPNSLIGGLAGSFDGPDILSLLVLAQLNSSGNLVAVPTITKIEVFADALPTDFWTDYLLTEEAIG